MYSKYRKPKNLVNSYTAIELEIEKGESLSACQMNNVYTFKNCFYIKG